MRSDSSAGVVVEEFDGVVGDSWVSFRKVEGRKERRSTPKDTVRIIWGTLKRGLHSVEIEGRILYHAKNARSERAGGVRRRLRRSRIGK